MKIKEIMQNIKDRGLPCVSENSDIREVIRVAVRFPHTRLVYVIDEQKKLLGTITIGSLIRHLYPYHYEDKIHPRDILRNIIVEKASHLMSSGNVNASPDETVDVILKRMASTGAKEIAVVDSNGCILADITAADLLRYYEL
jgi:CBS-domain-containing membrane protein